jgi:hypothetical protein
MSVEDDVITFERVLVAGQTPCGRGVYRWQRDGETLTLTALERDPCEARREVIDGIPYSLDH